MDQNETSPLTDPSRRYVTHNSDSMAYILLMWGMYVLFILLAPLMMLNCLNAIFVEGVITKITHKKVGRQGGGGRGQHDVPSLCVSVFFFF